MTLAEALAELPLIAILRGLTADDADAVGSALVDAGFRAIEVPLNSPDPLATIARLAARFAGQAAIGAGTVLDAHDLDGIRAAGGTFVVAPNTDPCVIEAARARDLVPVPGVATPSEAFAALKAGAPALKLFPAGSLGTGHYKAMRAVLPPAVPVYAVGGIDEDTMAPWIKAGIAGFGLGSSLYRPGDPAPVVGERARRAVDRLRQIQRT